MELALEKARKDSNLHYYKGLVHISQRQLKEGLQEIHKTIKYADESIARDYFVKGFCEASLFMLKEAIDDLDIAIKLNPELLDAYYIKGKCMHLLGDISALECYNQLIEKKPKDPLVYISKGIFLMINDSINDAIKSFQNANDIQETNIAY